PWQPAQNVNRVPQSHDYNRLCQLIKGESGLKIFNNEDMHWPYADACHLLIRCRDITKATQKCSELWVQNAHADQLGLWPQTAAPKEVAISCGISLERRNQVRDKPFTRFQPFAVGTSNRNLSWVEIGVRIAADPRKHLC